MRFESGPVGGQAVEVRVSKESLAEESEVNTLLTGDGTEVCGGPGAQVDGVTTMDICCSLTGRFVTIQATDTAVSALEISDIKITVAATACPDGPPSCQVRTSSNLPLVSFLHLKAHNCKTVYINNLLGDPSTGLNL